MSTAATKGFSLRPSDAVGGGLIDSGVVTIAEAIVVETGPGREFDYGGKATKHATALRVTLTQDDANRPAVEYYNFGDPNRYQIANNGRSVEAIEGVALSKKSGAYRFIQALVEAGFPETDLPLNGDVTFLTGIQVRVQRIAKTADHGEILLPVKGGLVARPGEKATGTAKRATASKPNGQAGRPTSASAKVTVPPDAELDEATRQTILNVLAQNGGSVARAQISGLAYKAAETAVKMRVGPRAYDEAFLAAGAAEGIWSFDGTTISL